MSSIIRHDKHYVDKKRVQKKYNFLKYHELKTRERKLRDKDIAYYFNVSSKTIERWNKRYNEDLKSHNEFALLVIKTNDSMLKRNFNLLAVKKLFR